MKRTVAVGVLILTAVLGLRAAGQVDSRRRAEEEQLRAAEVERRAVEALVNQRPEVLRLLERLQEIDRRLEEIKRVAVRPETVNQSLVKERAELEVELEKTRTELYSREAARREDSQSSIQAKEIEIMKVAEELKVLQAWSAELEKRRADLEMTIKSLMVQVAQEKADEAALRKKADLTKALETARGQVRDDPGRGMEEKLDVILKKLDLIERRLSDLEKKVQPNKQK
jgi:hypothetical protein